MGVLVFPTCDLETGTGPISLFSPTTRPVDQSPQDSLNHVVRSLDLDTGLMERLAWGGWGSLGVSSARAEPENGQDLWFCDGVIL